MKLIDDLKDIISSENKSKLVRNILLLGIIGVVFLFAGNLFNNQSSPPKVQKETKANIKQNSGSYTEQLSQDLEQVISLIDGVGKVRVSLMIKEGPTYNYEYNQNSNNKITNETDENGGKRQIQEKSDDKEVVVIREGDGSEKPLIKYEKKPEISGALIVAQGAENSQLKYEIYKAVSNFLDIPLYKINVLPYQRR